LPPRKRMAFQLCRLEGKSYDEAAAQLNISTESVKDYIKSCNALIRKQLSDNNPSMALLALLLYFQL
ncbi:MAG: RNA polymerase sigma-70 factor, partial [Bacteroidetes bacterium]|nr:RNA polymerase sigma-70 factor [Bacteroidota bacterium]